MEIENILAALVQKAANDSCDWIFKMLPDPDGETPYLEATFAPLDMTFHIYEDAVAIGDFELPSPSADIIAGHIIDHMLVQLAQLNTARAKQIEKGTKAEFVANVVPIKPDKPN